MKLFNNNLTKKFAAALLAGVMAVSLAACSSGSSAPASSAPASSAADSQPADAGNADAAGESYRIAIVQQMDHASLDEIRRAIEAELDAKAAETGTAIEYEVFNGQGDATVLGQIGTQVVSDGFDAVIPIATLAAQCMQTATEGTGIPVIFAAISDPEGAGLTAENVTGTSDALNTAFILDMMFAQNPDIQSVGLLYSLSEDNSTKPIAEAKEYLAAKQVKVVESTGNTNDEIVSAVNNMLDQVDAVFTPTDNVVMGAVPAFAEDLAEAGVAHYTGADSFVRAGSFATCGVNYTELGAYTADMALEALTTGSIPAVHVMEGGIITVNTETAAALKADYSVFSTMANSVVEVTTTGD